MTIKLFVSIFIFLSTCSASFGESYFSSVFGQTTDSIPADPNDVNAPESLVTAIFDVISGNVGQKRNWDRMRTLFLPDARLIAITNKRPDGTTGRKIMSIEDYIKIHEPLFEKDGFTEKQISMKKESFGNLVHIFCTFESSIIKPDGRINGRGINSIQTCYDGRRWWIVNIIWQNETTEFPLPDKYLH